MAGRIDLSSISILLLDFLFIQSRSAFVYGTSGLISYRSAPAIFATFSAACFVTPLALK